MRRSCERFYGVSPPRSSAAFKCNELPNKKLVPHCNEMNWHECVSECFCCPPSTKDVTFAHFESLLTSAAGFKQPIPPSFCFVLRRPLMWFDLNPLTGVGHSAVIFPLLLSVLPPTPPLPFPSSFSVKDVKPDALKGTFAQVGPVPADFHRNSREVKSP